MPRSTLHVVRDKGEDFFPSAIAPYSCHLKPFNECLYKR